MIAILILALIFGFDDKQPYFVLSYWLFNFMTILLFTAVSLGLHIYAQKFLARRYGCNAVIDLWKIKRISLRKEIKLQLAKNLTITSIPIGLIISIIVYILSKGQIFFAAITSLNIAINRAYRIGKRFTQLTNFESAKIAVVGPLTNILLALLISPIDIPLIKPFVTINIIMAISYMLPLPWIAGGTVFFGSKPLYVASAVFIGLIAVVMNFIGVIPALIIAAIFSIIALVLYLMYD